MKAEEPPGAAVGSQRHDPATRDAKVYATDRYGNKVGQAYEVKGDKIYATDKYGNRVGQAYVTKGDKVYATDKYGNRIGQAYVIKDTTPPPSERE